MRWPPVVEGTLRVRNDGADRRPHPVSAPRFVRERLVRFRRIQHRASLLTPIRGSSRTHEHSRLGYIVEVSGSDVMAVASLLARLRDVDHRPEVTIEDRRQPRELRPQSLPRLSSGFAEPGDARLVAIQLPGAAHDAADHNDRRDPAALSADCGTSRRRYD